MAYVQWATQVAPRVQPNSKANVADAPMQAMTVIPIRARKVIHIWQPLPAECHAGRNQDGLDFLLGQFQDERSLGFLGNCRLSLDNMYVNMSYEITHVIPTRGNHAHLVVRPAEGRQWQVHNRNQPGCVRRGGG